MTYRQVLDNIALFSCNPDSMAHYAVVGTGVTLVNHQSGGIDSRFTFAARNTQLFGLTSGRRTNSHQWGTAPVSSPGRLNRLSCAFKIVATSWRPQIAGDGLFIDDQSGLLACVAEYQLMGLLPQRPSSSEKDKASDEFDTNVGKLADKIKSIEDTLDRDKIVASLHRKKNDLRKIEDLFKKDNKIFGKTIFVKEKHPIILQSAFENFLSAKNKLKRFEQEYALLLAQYFVDFPIQFSRRFPCGWYSTNSSHFASNSDYLYSGRYGKTNVGVDHSGVESLTAFAITLQALATSDPPTVEITRKLVEGTTIKGSVPGVVTDYRPSDFRQSVFGSSNRPLLLPRTSGLDLPRFMPFTNQPSGIIVTPQTIQNTLP